MTSEQADLMIQTMQTVSQYSQDSAYSAHVQGGELQFLCHVLTGLLYLSLAFGIVICALLRRK